MSGVYCYMFDEASVKRSLELREYILGMKKPFCWVDLRNCALDDGIPESDIDLLKIVFNKMYQEGLIIYDEIPEEDRKEGCATWAFYVA